GTAASGANGRQKNGWEQKRATNGNGEHARNTPLTADATHGPHHGPRTPRAVCRALVAMPAQVPSPVPNPAPASTPLKVATAAKPGGVRGGRAGGNASPPVRTQGKASKPSPSRDTREKQWVKLPGQRVNSPVQKVKLSGQGARPLRQEDARWKDREKCSEIPGVNTDRAAAAPGAVPAATEAPVVTEMAAGVTGYRGDGKGGGGGVAFQQVQNLPGEEKGKAAGGVGGSVGYLPQRLVAREDCAAVAVEPPTGAMQVQNHSSKP
ncbi:unnamed protein product, partial [Discosporangium mesarthrocarpum]